MDCRRLTVVLSCLAVTVRSQLSPGEAYDYCEPRLKLCKVLLEHTMCKYPVPGPSSQCTEGIHEPLSSAEKDRILYWHNKFRSYVANGTEKIKTRKLPTAANMRQMYWDGELETIATRWAEQCTSMTNPVVYDKCRNTKRFRVSQNVGTRRVNGTSIEKQAPQIVITWYKENKDFDPVLVDKFLPSEDEKVAVKQFANLIWADTYAIGCARVIFQEKLPLSDRDPKTTVWTIERLVCNYGPGGNEVGRPIYKRGAPCEKCPGGTECSRIFPGLCAFQGANKTEGKGPSKENEPSDGTGQRLETETGILPEMKGEEEEEDEEEEKNEEDYSNCQKGDCYKNVNFQNHYIKLPLPTARKKSPEVGPVAPAPGKDSNIRKPGRTVSSSRKVRRVKSQDPVLKDGDRCKCFIPLDADNGSSRCCRNPFLLVFYTFIVVETFLFSTCHWN